VLFQGGCGVGQYVLGQVGVVDRPGDGDGADEDAESEDGFALSSLVIGAADEVSQHGQAFLHLTGVAGLG
jgi:hypothetical protein